MDYYEIRELLKKYWLGASSLEEERILKDFYKEQSENLPADLQEAAPFFTFYRQEALQTMPEFDAPWKVRKPKRKEKGNMTGFLRIYWEYAAILLLLLGSVLFLPPFSGSQKQALATKDTYQDPKDAMMATREALEILAGNLKKGKEEMSKLALFHEAQQKVSGE